MWRIANRIKRIDRTLIRISRVAFHGRQRHRRRFISAKSLDPLADVLYNVVSTAPLGL